MSQNELSAKIHELRELRRMADESAAEIVNFWNECHKHNGQYLFDTTFEEVPA